MHKEGISFCLQHKNSIHVHVYMCIVIFKVPNIGSRDVYIVTWFQPYSVLCIYIKIIHEGATYLTIIPIVQPVLHCNVS